MTSPSPLPYIKWTSTPDGRLVQVWICPQGTSPEEDTDASDLTALEDLAEGSDPNATKFNFDFDFDFMPLASDIAPGEAACNSRAVVKLGTETALDEFALQALLVQCGEASSSKR